MIGPAILTWMEQGNLFFRNTITAVGSCRFLQRAGDACQREVLGIGGPLGGAWLNMIDVKSGFLRRLRQEAILAGLAGALAYQLDESNWYVLTHGPCALPPLLHVVS